MLRWLVFAILLLPEILKWFCLSVWRFSWCWWCHTWPWWLWFWWMSITGQLYASCTMIKLFCSVPCTFILCCCLAIYMQVELAHGGRGSSSHDRHSSYSSGSSRSGVSRRSDYRGCSRLVGNCMNNFVYILKSLFWHVIKFLMWQCWLLDFLLLLLGKTWR